MTTASPTPRRRGQMTPELLARAKALRRRRWNCAAIGRELGLSRDCVSYWTQPATRARRTSAAAARQRRLATSPASGHATHEGCASPCRVPPSKPSNDGPGERGSGPRQPPACCWSRSSRRISRPISLISNCHEDSFHC